MVFGVPTAATGSRSGTWSPDLPGEKLTLTTRILLQFYVTILGFSMVLLFVSDVYCRS